MPRKSSWHSIKQDVYHNNTKCTEGNNIESRYYRTGTGGKRLCKKCAKLNAGEIIVKAVTLKRRRR